MNAENRSQHKHAIEQDVSECIIDAQRRTQGSPMNNGLFGATCSATE